jgi:hypothetical protein
MMTGDRGGTSRKRVCRALFGGDEARMLAWGRRYLAAYPHVHGPEFHLGAEFRRIVGTRNREQWWRTTVAALERGDQGAAVAVADAVSDASGAGRVAEGAPGLASGTPTRRGLLRVEDRLRLFDEATERQRRRERGLPAEDEPDVPPDRGWTREELYERAPRRR